MKTVVVGEDAGEFVEDGRLVLVYLPGRSGLRGAEGSQLGLVGYRRGFGEKVHVFFDILAILVVLIYLVVIIGQVILVILVILVIMVSLVCLVNFEILKERD